jgi:enoyl-CoA hydratase/carnithine racemase
MADLEYTVKDGIGTILLNRPARKNAFTLQMIDDWAEALRSARTDPEVNGTAVGAGIDMPLMCDIRLLAQSARMSEGYIRVGLVPGDGGCCFLPRLTGMAKALELLWTGDFIDAAEAVRLGIASYAYPDEDFVAAWRGFAARIAAQAPVNVRMIKRAAYQSSHTDLRTALDLISSHMAVVQATEDSAEAMEAFRDRRPPLFRGR